MRLTYEQARKLGIDERIIAEAEARASSAERSEAIREDLAIAPKRPRSRPADGLNKTERAFWEMLQRSIKDDLIVKASREPMTLRLGGRTRYKPDFLVYPDVPCGAWGIMPTFVEIKGFMRDDAAVKLKIAAEMYHEFRWLLVRREGRHGWDVREVDRNGIGREPIAVPWIGG